MSAGRPRKFETPDQMDEAVQQYFRTILENELPATVTGLARHLGMSRQALCNYEGRDEFVDTVKNAKQMVEEAIESGMYRGYSTPGAIFSLKNNFGWRDQQEIINSGEQIQKIIMEDAE